MSSGIKRLSLIVAAVVVLGGIAWMLIPSPSHTVTPTDTTPTAIVPEFTGATPAPALGAQGYISVYVSPQGKEYVLITKGEHLLLPIAGITTLMTAFGAESRLAPDAPITLTKTALAEKGAAGGYHVGARLPLSEALAAMLIGSQNEVAAAIASAAGTDFVPAMNEEAATLGLLDTRFVNAVGVDPSSSTSAANRSSPYDTYRLLRTVAEKDPAILALTLEQTHDVKDVSGKVLATIATTDQLLASSSLPYAIRGGVTGESPLAKQNLALETEGPCGGTLYSDVLGSADSFSDMRALLDYDSAVYLYACK